MTGAYHEQFNSSFCFFQMHDNAAGCKVTTGVCYCELPQLQLVIQNKIISFEVTIKIAVIPLQDYCTPVT